MKRWQRLVSIFLFYTVFSLCAQAEPELRFSVKALFKDRAMIEVNGEERFLTSGEQTPEGIKLISSTAHEAVILCHGKEHTLYINQSVYSGGSSSPSDVDKEQFHVPDKLVQGKTVSFKVLEEHGVKKYILNSTFSYPKTMAFGQEAVWIASGNQLLMFDIRQEAFGLFDHGYGIKHNISDIKVSDEFVILETTANRNNKKINGLFIYDYSRRKLLQQLNQRPRSYVLTDNELWFLDYNRGAGFIRPQRRNLDVDLKDKLLDSERKHERANYIAASGDDIWYSHASNYPAQSRQRLKEKCISRYNRKTGSQTSYTRKQMNIDSDFDCTYIGASDTKVWVSHGYTKPGLSYFDTESSKWSYLQTSRNHVKIGGQPFQLHNDDLWMLNNSQLIRLNTRNFHADVILGNAAIMNQWQSAFAISQGYAWLSTLESVPGLSKNQRLVLYAVPEQIWAKP